MLVTVGCHNGDENILNSSQPAQKTAVDPDAPTTVRVEIFSRSDKSLGEHMYEGSKVEFSRSISDQPLSFKWEGTLNEEGVATVTLPGPGYYVVRASFPGEGSLVIFSFNWGSIPINQGENYLELAIGSSIFDISTTPIRPPLQVLKNELFRDGTPENPTGSFGDNMIQIGSFTILVNDDYPKPLEFDIALYDVFTNKYLTDLGLGSISQNLVLLNRDTQVGRTIPVLSDRNIKTNFYEVGSFILPGITGASATFGIFVDTRIQPDVDAIRLYNSSVYSPLIPVIRIGGQEIWMKGYLQSMYLEGSLSPKSFPIIERIQVEGMPTSSSALYKFRMRRQGNKNTEHKQFGFKIESENVDVSGLRIWDTSASTYLTDAGVDLTDSGIIAVPIGSTPWDNDVIVLGEAWKEFELRGTVNGWQEGISKLSITMMSDEVLSNVSDARGLQKNLIVWSDRQSSNHSLDSFDWFNGASLVVPFDPQTF